ncbi:g10381 [Coccomyxa viridis]|uniref:G10381 protein n=1 Tax=Coccomyxa viridis TaxID=1274662 RepID=A0ABP1G557_9CHLO
MPTATLVKPLLAKVQADVIEGLPDPTHDARAVDSITASSNSDGAQLPGQAGPATLKKRGSSFASSSPFRGVTRHSTTGRYEAHLWDSSWARPKTGRGGRARGRQVYLGGWHTEEEAAEAYDIAAMKYWGAEASLNYTWERYTGKLEEMQDMSREEVVAMLKRRSTGFSRGQSKYRGVTRHHQQGRWEARIGRVRGKRYQYLGTFNSEEEAAQAYDIAAIQHRGSKAVTNFSSTLYEDASVLPDNVTGSPMHVDQTEDFTARCTSAGSTSGASGEVWMTPTPLSSGVSDDLATLSDSPGLSVPGESLQREESIELFPNLLPELFSWADSFSALQTSESLASPSSLLSEDSSQLLHTREARVIGAPWSCGIEPAELHNVWQEEQPWPLEPGTDTHTFQEEAAQMLQGLSDDEIKHMDGMLASLDSFL